MKIAFEKWHGCQNDFMVVWTNPNEAKFLRSSLQRQAPQLCSRDGLGVGADGILVLSKEHGNELPNTLTIINQDGSIAKNCGNGLRCAAASVYVRHQDQLKKGEQLDQVELDVEGREFLCQFLHGQKSNSIPMISVNMGPLRLNEQNAWHTDAMNFLNKDKIAPFAKQLGDVFSADIGNLHLVFLNDSAQSSDALFTQVGPQLQNTPHWDGINVHMAYEANWDDDELNKANNALGSQVGDLYEAWVFERGVGPTNACGSGACAIGASILSQGFANRDEWIAVKMPGGTVFVKQIDPSEGVLLAGNAEFVFSGEVEI
ncbi:MAG: hypothetical protein HRU09_06645 [Oligoflexales bacterium]|nr:hypothetical protein [Oligoflexales bacterium]